MICMIPLAMRYDPGTAVEISAKVWTDSGSWASCDCLDAPNAL